MRPLRLAVSALLASLIVPPAGADPVITKSYAYYTIGGRTGAELDKELSRHGPMLEGSGTRHPGVTRIKLGGSVKYESSGGRCRVLEALVTLDTRLTLPRWKDRKRAEIETVLIWDTLSADIKRHEERHAEIARQYARKLEKALESLRPETTCAQMETKVDATTRKILEAHSADQDRFDRVEAASFERRMTRMLGYKFEKYKNAD